MTGQRPIADDVGGDTPPADPVTQASVAALLGGVAVVACLLPARRAARLDPMVALRHE